MLSSCEKEIIEMEMGKKRKREEEDYHTKDPPSSSKKYPNPEAEPAQHSATDPLPHHIHRNPNLNPSPTQTSTPARHSQRQRRQRQIPRNPKDVIAFREGRIIHITSVLQGFIDGLQRWRPSFERVVGVMERILGVVMMGEGESVEDLGRVKREMEIGGKKEGGEGEKVRVKGRGKGRVGMEEEEEVLRGLNYYRLLRGWFPGFGGEDVDVVLIARIVEGMEVLGILKEQGRGQGGYEDEEGGREEKGFRQEDGARKMEREGGIRNPSSSSAERGDVDTDTEVRKVKARAGNLLPTTKENSSCECGPICKFASSSSSPKSPTLTTSNPPNENENENELLSHGPSTPKKIKIQTETSYDTNREHERKRMRINQDFALLIPFLTTSLEIFIDEARAGKPVHSALLLWARRIKGIKKGKGKMGDLEWDEVEWDGGKVSEYEYERRESEIERRIVRNKEGFMHEYEEVEKETERIERERTFLRRLRRYLGVVREGGCWGYGEVEFVVKIELDEGVWEGCRRLVDFVDGEEEGEDGEGGAAYGLESGTR